MFNYITITLLTYSNYKVYINLDKTLLEILNEDGNPGIIAINKPWFNTYFTTFWFKYSPLKKIVYHSLHSNGNFSSYNLSNNCIALEP